MPDTRSEPPYIISDHDELLSSNHFLGYGETGRQRAYEEIRHIAPDVELLSDEGSSAVVFANESTAYKVSRGGRYDYTENEASMIKLLGDAGFAPRLYTLHDTPMSQRFADDAYGIITHKDNFPRTLNPHLTVPIIEMERLEIPSDTPPRFDTLATRDIREQFKQLAKFAIDNHIELRNDTEMTVDMRTGRIKFVDLGGVSQDTALGPVECMAGPLQYLVRMEFLSGTAYPISGFNYESLQEIKLRYEQNGLDGVADLITVGKQDVRANRLRSILSKIATR